MTDTAGTYFASEEKKVRKKGFTFKKPNGPNGWKFGFVYRLFVMLVGGTVASSILVLWALISGGIPPTTVIWGFPFFAILVPMLVSEAIRYRVYSAVVSAKDEYVTLAISIRGIKVSEKDAVMLSSFDRSFDLPNLGYTSHFKRILDFFVVVASFPFVLPFFVVLSALIALDGHNPFFRQERVGKNGRRFYIWKFRTMVPNAEEKLERYLNENPSAKKEWEQSQMLYRDPRITTIGSILRRSSIDELPQVVNVLLGDMSLVGPRPLMPSQQALYPGEKYYSVRPGLTGMWQISSRSQSSFAERAVYDDTYTDNLSLWTDIKIVLRTVPVVLSDRF